MEWSRIKTILICLFAVVNLFLFSVYFRGSDRGELNEEIVDETVEILRQNGVKIDRELIKKDYENIKVCNVENAFADADDMFEKMWEKGSYFTEENTLTDGISFSFVPDKNSVFYGIDISDVEKALQKSGLISKGRYVKEETDKGVVFYLKFEDKIIFDSYVCVTQNNGKVDEINGYNVLGDAVSEGGAAGTVSLPEILINFASGEESGENAEIVNLCTGYYIGARDGIVRVSASPVWQIKTSDGQTFYYDMRNGDLLE